MNGWTSAPFWSIAQRRDRTGYASAELLSVYREWGVVKRASRDDNFNRASEDLSDYKLVREGDLVLNKMKTWQGSLGVSPYEGIVSPAYFVCELSERVHGRFLHHLLRSRRYIAHYEAGSKGIRPNQWDLPYDVLRQIPVLLPPLEEQRRIADFLDDRVSRIDRIIAARREQAGLEDEAHQSKREALLVSTSTPQMPLRRLAVQVQTGPFGSQLHSDEYVDDGWPIVNPANIVDGRLVSLPGMTIGTEVRDRLSRHILQVDDIVFGRRGELGRAGIVSLAQSGWVCGTGSLRLRLSDPRVRPAFVAQLLTTSEVRHYFQRQSVGSTMDNLNTDILLAAPLRLPKRDTQDRLLDQLGALDQDHLCRSTDFNQSLKLLTEYKSSLITAAVTGELDVSTAGSSIPG